MQRVFRVRNGFWMSTERTSLVPGDIFRFLYGSAVYVAQSHGGWALRRLAEQDIAAWDAAGYPVQ